MNHARIRLNALASFATFMLFVVALLPPPHALAESSGDDNGTKDPNALEIKTVDELSGRRIGVLNGGIFAQLLIYESWGAVGGGYAPTDI